MVMDTAYGKASLDSNQLANSCGLFDESSVSAFQYFIYDLKYVNTNRKSI